MTLHTIVNSVGLVADIIGAVMVWKYGLPAEVSRSGAVHLILEQTDERETELAERYDILAKIGVGSLIVGFGLQLLSNFL